jgi:hypothetical protein
VQEDVLIDAAIVGVKVSVAPLVRRVRRVLVIVPGVIDAHRDHVLLRTGLHEFCDVETKSHHAVLVPADEVSVEVELATVTYAFEFEKDFVSVAICRECEMFAIPGHACAQVFDIFAERVVLVPGVRCGDSLPA